MNRRVLLASAASLALVTRTRQVRASATPEPNGVWAEPNWFADPTWLSEHLEDANVRVVGLTSVDDFSAGHIPGATQIDWRDLALTDSATATITTWQAIVTQQLADRTILPTTTVAIYDGGTFYAARLWWILDLLGHKDKRILDGGLPAWVAAGQTTEPGTPVTGRAIKPYAAVPNLAVLADVGAVETAVAAGSAVLVDARSQEEFAKGHIPGAVNVPFTDNAVPDSGGMWRAPDELRAMYVGLGVSPNEAVIPYCSTGVRSANTWFTLRALGYGDVRLFSGSFAEWTSDPDRPIETT